MEKNQLLFIIIPAGTLFLLSFLTGIVSGVGFFTIILRALFFGIVFGAAGFGISFVIKKFLPELLAYSEQDGEESLGDGDTDPQATDSAVDIVVEDDGDENEKLYSTGGGGEDSFVEEYTEEPSGSAAPGTSDGTDTSDNRDDADSWKRDAESEADVEELQNVDESEDESVDESEDESGEFAGDEEMADEFEELDSAEEGSDSSLPDLDSFSDSFQSVAESQDGEASRDGASMEIDVMGTHEDSATVAKAVRTIMKRDQEG